METFSALLAICAGNALITGEFPAQRPVTRNFDVFFDLRLNKRLRKQSWGWWFEKSSTPLWRHSNRWTHSILQTIEWMSIMLNSMMFSQFTIFYLLLLQFMVRKRMFSIPKEWLWGRLCGIFKTWTACPSWGRRIKNVRYGMTMWLGLIWWVTRKRKVTAGTFPVVAHAV